MRAYAQAAAAVDFLERRFGFPALREALVAFGRGEAEAAVLGKMTGMSAEALEREFRAELTRRFARYDKQYLPPQPARAAAAASPPKAANARDWVARGLGALRTGDVDEAKKALERARAVPQPSADDQADTLFLAGEIALARRDADAAVAAFEGLLDVGSPPRDGYDVRVRLGLAEIHRKRPAAAEAHLRRAVELDPSRVEPHALLAEMYKSQQRTADRLVELAAAIRLDPQTDRVAKEVVLGEAKAGRSARVTELAPIAIFIDPANADLHAALGRALAATGKTAAGAAALERALLFGPQSPALLHLELATLYDTLGDRKRAAGHRAAAGATGGAGADFCRSASPTGSVSVNVVPAPGGLATSIWPPWSTTTCCTSASPSPVPRSLVEKNGSKIFPISAAPMPGPESWMTIAIRPALRAHRDVDAPRAAVRHRLARVANQVDERLPELRLVGRDVG